MADTGARPKERMLRDIQQLEKYEKHLKKELEKLTPKKETKSSLEILREERASLQKQVSIKRQSAEKQKLLNEIEALKTQLASISIENTTEALNSASALPTIPPPPAKLHELRGKPELNSLVDIRMPVDLFDPEINTGKNLSNSNIRVQSGKSAKSKDLLVKNPQLWPHSFVPGRLCKHSKIEYNDLNMAIVQYCYT